MIIASAVGETGWQVTTARFGMLLHSRRRQPVPSRPLPFELVQKGSNAPYYLSTPGKSSTQIQNGSGSRNSRKECVGKGKCLSVGVRLGRCRAQQHSSLALVNCTLARLAVTNLQTVRYTPLGTVVPSFDERQLSSLMQMSERRLSRHCGEGAVRSKKPMLRFQYWVEIGAAIGANPILGGSLFLQPRRGHFDRQKPARRMRICPRGTDNLLT